MIVLNPSPFIDEKRTVPPSASVRSLIPLSPLCSDMLLQPFPLSSMYISKRSFRNLSIMSMYSEKMRMSMLTEHGIFNVLHGRAQYHAIPGMQVSVFPSAPLTKLTFKGLKYPVSNRSFQWLWEGSLNEALDDAFTVETDGGEPVVVYRALNS